MPYLVELCARNYAPIQLVQQLQERISFAVLYCLTFSCCFVFNKDSKKLPCPSLNALIASEKSLFAKHCFIGGLWTISTVSSSKEGTLLGIFPESTLKKDMSGC
jgi:hypothetical protein